MATFHSSSFFNLSKCPAYYFFSNDKNIIAPGIQAGGGIVENMDALADLGQQVEGKIIETSALINKLEAELNKKEEEPCFPKCSIHDNKWTGYRNCQKTEEMKKESSARENYERQTGKKLLLGRDDFSTIIDPKYIC